MPVQICQQNWIVISACRKIIQALVNFTNSKLAYQSFGHSNRYYSYEAVFFIRGTLRTHSCYFTGNIQRWRSSFTASMNTDSYSRWKWTKNVKTLFGKCIFAAWILCCVNICFCMFLVHLRHFTCFVKDGKKWHVQQIFKNSNNTQFYLICMFLTGLRSETHCGNLILKEASRNMCKKITENCLEDCYTLA